MSVSAGGGSDSSDKPATSSSSPPKKLKAVEGKDGVVNPPEDVEAAEATATKAAADDTTEAAEEDMASASPATQPTVRVDHSTALSLSDRSSLVSLIPSSCSVGSSVLL